MTKLQILEIQLKAIRQMDNALNNFINTFDICYTDNNEYCADVDMNNYDISSEAFNQVFNGMSIDEFKAEHFNTLMEEYKANINGRIESINKENKQCN